MENAVIYARFSSHNQREESIEGQLRECKAYAKAHKYHIVNTYIDRAISGKTDQRPSFQEMIKDAERAGGFSYVIVYSLDRFSRDKYDAAIYKHRLKAKGIRVISAKENISDDPSGILMESLLEGMAEYYSAELAVKIRRGMTENALKGRWASGIPPYGYRINPATRKLELDPETAPAAKFIFEQYAKGVKLTTITKDLNDKGYRTYRGNKFNKGSYGKMFECQAYIGCFVWNEIKIEGGIPAMISKDLFDRCQNRHRASKHSHYNKSQARDSSIYPLSGKLVCGECDTPMVGICGTSKTGSIYRYYVCRNHKSNGKKCPTPAFSANKLEWAIASKIADMVQDSALMKEVSIKFAENISKSVDTTHRDSMVAEKKEIDKQYNKLIIAFAQDENVQNVTGLLKNKLNDLEERSADLEHAIARENERIERSACKPEEAAAFIKDMLTQAKTDEDNLIDRTLVIKAFLKKATIVKRKDDEKFTVLLELNVTPDPNKPSRSAEFLTSAEGSQNSILVTMSGKFANTQIYIYFDSVFLIFTYPV